MWRRRSGFWRCFLGKKGGFALVVDYRIGNEVNALEFSLETLKGLHVAPIAGKEDRKKEEEES